MGVADRCSKAQVVNAMRQIATTLLALPLLGGQPVAAQTAMVITLSCDGTMQQDTADTREQVTKLGLIINLAEQTVVAFGIAAHIDEVDASSITFSGEGPIDRGSQVATLSALRAIDRGTGIVCSRRDLGDQTRQGRLEFVSLFLLLIHRGQCWKSKLL
jgi:hypothetical protein